MAAIARKYNPGFLTDDELVASFCVRTREFKSIVEMLRECTGSSNPHQIVIGPRGSGKTSLLLRVAAEVRGDVALSAHFFPIVFAEESYEVATTGEFWLECLSRLAAQAPRRDGGPDLERTVEDLRTNRDDRILAGRCLASLLDFADRQGKRLVLMVENLNMMFRDMADPDTGWRLRHTLQTEPRIVMLASATSRFNEIDNPEHALYQQFRVLPLRPLDTNECAVLWETVSGRCPVPETIRSLEILTGGSPRLLTIVARFGAGLSFRELMADLLNLVDDHTEYFKSHIESLPPQERRVYLALAELWKPATTREIADRSRLETSKCSAQLARLMERGVVEVEGGTVRRKQYYLTERLYNIYYLLRRRHRADFLVEALIHFMESYYSPSELKDIGAGIIREMESFSAEMCAFHQIALKRLMESPALAGHREDLLAMVTKDSARVLDRDIAPPDTVRRAQVGVEPDEGDGCHPHDADSDEPVELEVANRLFDEAIGLRNQNRAEEALVTFNEIVRRFGESDTPNLSRLVAKAFVSEGVTLGRLNRAEEALASFDEVVRRFEASSSSALIEQVVQALVNKGVALSELNRPEDALDVFGGVLRRFGDMQTIDLLEPLAVAHFYSGLTLAGLSRPREALAAFDELVRRFGENDAPAVLDLVSTALVNRGVTLNALNRPKDALLAFDEVVRRYEGQEAPALVESVAHALFSKGAIYDDLNQLGEALTVYDEVLRRFGESDGATVLGLVAQSGVNKGVMLDKLDRLEDALSAFDEVVRRYGGQEAPALVESVAQALVKKGFTLVRLNRPGDALSPYDEAVQRLRGSGTPALFTQVAEALVGKGAALGELGQAEKALEVFDEVVRQYDGNETPSAIELVAAALLNKGSALIRLNRPQDALVVYGEVVNRFEDNNAPAVLELVAKALVNEGAILGELHRAEEALSACDEVVHRFGQNDASAFLHQVAMALINKGSTLTELNRPEEALTVYDEVVQRFGESDHPELHAVAEWAHLQKAEIELKHQRYEAAIKTVDQVLGEQRRAESPANRLRGHLIRLKAARATGDRTGSEQDIKVILSTLPQIESLPKAILDALMESSIELGSAHMCDLIEPSPSARLLLPLTTALQQELGLEPRVAREVAEVAQDIRRDLAKLKEERTMALSREKGASPAAMRPDQKDG